uniref:CCAAT-binding factor domain-containing protein n=1 Tax=Globodera rostochiensis TaxID=31243 RepID=A0A914HKL0_GLORO
MLHLSPYSGYGKAHRLETNRTMKKCSTKTDKRAKHQRLKAKKKLSKMATKGKLSRTVRDQMKDVQRRQTGQKQKRMAQIRKDWLFDRRVRERELSSSDLDETVEAQMDCCRMDKKPRNVRKRKKDSTGQMDEDELEQQIRSFVGECAEEELLPVKIGGKLMKRVKVRALGEAAESEAVEEVKPGLDYQHEHCGKVEELETNSDGMDGTELSECRQKTAAESESMLAGVASAIVAEPQENVSKFRLLLQMASGVDQLSPSVREHSQKLAVASSTEIFVNLLEKNANKLLHKSKKGPVEDESSTFCTQFAFLCVRCLCRLIEKCAHFNYANNVLTCLIRLSTTPWKKMSEEICATISEVFRADLQLGISAHGAKAIALLVDRKAAYVPAGLLATFLALNITEIGAHSAWETKKAQNQGQLGSKWKSRRSRKYDKQIGKIDAELKEAIVAETHSTKLELATQTTKSVFLTYCRVLKRMPATALLRPVLAGLSKFVHLINAELHEDLARHLGILVQQKQLNFSEVLLCVRTAAVVLEGEGRLLGVDLLSFYGALFAALPNACFQPEQSLPADLSVLAQSLHLLFVRRRKTVPLARVAAFTKRLALVALPLQTRFQAVLLLTVRRLLLTHPALLFLVHMDGEAPLTNGRFLPDSVDADHSNGMATNLQSELRLFAQHPNVLIRSVSLNLLNGIPSTGRFRLEAKWATVEPSEFSLVDDLTVDDKSAPYLAEILRYCEKSGRKYCSTTLCSVLCDFARSTAVVED